MPKIFRNGDDSSIMQASLFNSGGCSRFDQIDSKSSSIELYDQLREFDGPLSVKYFSCNEKKPKNDRCNFVFLTFFLYGVSSFMPWHIFNFAQEYFINSKLNTPISYASAYRKHFGIITTIIWQFTFLCSIILNLAKSDRFNQIARIPIFMFSSTLIMLSLLSICLVDSNNWSNSFFICLCLILFLNAISSGIIFSSGFYQAAKLPSMKFTTSIMIGYVTILSYIRKFIKQGKSPMNLAMTSISFFVVTIGILLVSLICHLSLSLSSFYRYHMDLVKKVEMLDIELKSTKCIFLYYKTLISIWPFIMALFLNTFSCGLVYPFYQMKIKPISNISFLTSCKEKLDGWFNEITSHLFHSSMFFLGCSTALLVRWPSPKLIKIISFFKSILMIAFYMTCNFEPNQRKHIKVFIKNDYIYSIASITFFYVTGHLSCLLMMYTSRHVKSKYSSMAAILSVLTFVFGSIGGMQLSRIYEMLILL